MEKQAFPGVLEVITGKFLRHSKAFYQWRIKDRLKKLKSNKKESFYDDLAVAYDKGKTRKAINIMQERYQKNPELEFSKLYYTKSK